MCFPEQMVIDYEHQTQKAEFNGLPAPAAGWSLKHEVRGDGVYVIPEWTEPAAGYIALKQYKYISPVFSYDSKTGEVLMLFMAGLTNTPGLSDLTELKPAMLKHFLTSQDEENNVDKELLKELGLPENATPDQVKAAVAALKTTAQAADDAKTTAEAQVATLTAEKTAADTELATLKAAKGTDADVVVVATLQSQVATLQAQLNTNEVAALVTEGLADGRILEGTRTWAEELGKKDVAALKGFLAAAPKIAALQGQQSAGMNHGGGASADGLTAEELAVCEATGMSVADLVAEKKLAAV